MKIKKIKSAFTLVELIVVITILAILATIAFISFQGSVTDANNTKVVSDVRNLVSKISIRGASGISFKDLFLDGSTSNKPNSLNVFGGNSVTDYDSGKLDFLALQESKDDFNDEQGKEYIYSYAYALITSNGEIDDYSYFQVSGQLIDNNGIKTAIVKGNYTPKIIGTDSPSLIAEKTDNTVFIVNDGDASNMY